MTSLGTFPFGQPVQAVVQQDRTPKRVFILGVYASAVHARWIGPNGRTLVNALAVASEPYIFWRGDGAEEILSRIPIPAELGRLVPPDAKFNGPSGLALDEHYLKPLGLTREDAWLCDLVPNSCMNPGQKAAIDRAYGKEIVAQYHLPVASLPDLHKQLKKDTRREAILGELRESQAGLLILLGDQPIRWFLHYYCPDYKVLSDFGSPYGQRHPIHLNGMDFDVLPLIHPRQAGRLGVSSEDWFREHQKWEKEQAPILEKELRLQLA
ncbi:MAG: hypothetical protein PHQ40_21335 [Anaerolineaceae bacterium]|nr:hypothetical protein [Anaerolineaceae bacterium]